MLYNGHNIITPKYVIELARQQRQNLTKTEQIMWSKLRNKQLEGYRFRRQHPVYRYILDFYCHKTMIAVEIDGDIHTNRIEYDNYRDEFLNCIGIITLRFSVSEVLNNTTKIISVIRHELLKL